MRARAWRLILRSTFAVVLPLAGVTATGSFAQGLGEGGSKAEAERAIQAYLAMWSRNDDVRAASVARFYAPRVIYYGKPMSRGQVLADKLSFIRTWPQRSYREVPGSLTAHCNGDRSLCLVKADMIWSRTDRRGRTESGKAHLSFAFVPSDGQRKIARESARLF
jgi:hypothetical protein